MIVSGSIALVTGANGGIGHAFVDDLLRRGATKVYIAARDPAALSQLLASGDERLVPIKLDITDADQIATAVAAAPDITLLINNAGYAAFGGAIGAPDLKGARQEMEVNYFGTLALTRAFAPVLAAAGGGAIVNMLSMLSLISMPAAAGYSASKAASLSVTRSVRAELVAQATQVIGVLAVQTETAMGADLPEPRMKPAEVVSDALDALEAGLSEEVAAGAQTRGVFDAFTANPIGVQAMMSTRLPKAA